MSSGFRPAAPPRGLNIGSLFSLMFQQNQAAERKRSRDLDQAIRLASQGVPLEGLSEATGISPEILLAGEKIGKPVFQRQEKLRKQKEQLERFEARSGTEAVGGLASAITPTLNAQGQPEFSPAQRQGGAASAIQDTISAFPDAPGLAASLLNRAAGVGAGQQAAEQQRRARADAAESRIRTRPSPFAQAVREAFPGDPARQGDLLQRKVVRQALGPNGTVIELPDGTKIVQNPSDRQLTAGRLNELNDRLDDNEFIIEGTQFFLDALDAVPQRAGVTGSIGRLSTFIVENLRQVAATGNEQAAANLRRFEEFGQSVLGGVSADAARGRLDPTVAAQFDTFLDDPEFIGSADFWENALAYTFARSETRGRVTDQGFERAKKLFQTRGLRSPVGIARSRLTTIQRNSRRKKRRNLQELRRQPGVDVIDGDATPSFTLDDQGNLIDSATGLPFE